MVRVRHTERSSYTRCSAEKLLSPPQLVAALAIAVAVFAGLILGTHVTLVVLVTAATLLYVAIILQRMLIHTAAYFYHDPTTVTCASDDPDLPIYTVLVPMHDEVAIIPSHIAAMKRLDYPRDRLQIIHLLESDDKATIAALEAQDLPSYFQRILIPLLGPRTKPKALNYGLALARGEYVTVYDAEDRPDPDQLLKAVALFRVEQSDVACLQARLKYAEGKRWYNRFYSVDYTTHFWELLRGLSKLNGTFPLGGTSNHFRVDDLREMALRSSPGEPEILPAWDPSNVTEDADLAVVIACSHKRIIPLDSTTEEESPNHLFGRGGASRQRRRWLKGYLQTGLVHSRHPVQEIRQMGLWDYASYMLVIFGTPVALILNPIFWSLTVAYGATRSLTIVALFPTPVYYLGLSAMVFGNLGFFYQLLVSCCRAEDWESVPKMFLVPVWWAFNSLTAIAMYWELLRPSTRYRWNKTAHGHSAKAATLSAS